MITSKIESMYCTETPGNEERSFMHASDSITSMNQLKVFHQLPRKTCTDCGTEIIEQQESLLFQCEKCLRYCE
ncbi:protein YhfH [Anaerobacillus sp. MEB173]|uniref:protein YhfH n=1 Tax=Anaerobacillus sp. MEB173 TaxID=3383345 RepID=UPI003F8F2849